MEMIGAGDQQAIDRLDGEKLLDRPDQARIRSDIGGPLPHDRIRLENRHHIRIRQKRQIAQMLLPHHAAADHTVTHCHIPSRYFSRDT